MNFGAIRVAFHPIVKTWAAKGKVLFSKKYLLYTNTGISLILSTTGDYLNQKYQIHKKEMTTLDKKRSRDVAITALFIGPFCHYWYLFLDWWMPARTAKVLAKKILVDQVICSPIVIGLFLIITSVLEGKTWNTVMEENKGKGATLYTAEWLVWPPAQVINFYFLPTRFRVLYDNTVSLAFDCYFSRVKYGKEGRVESDKVINNSES